MMHRPGGSLGVLGLSLLLAGCGSEKLDPAPAAAEAPNAVTAEAASETLPQLQALPDGAATDAPPALPKISLGGARSSPNAPGESSEASVQNGANFTRDEVLAAMKPMQILRDEWNAIRQKSVGGQDAGEKQVWIWDFRTAPKQPSLVMNSPEGTYFSQVRLTYTPVERRYQMKLTDADDNERVFTGDFSEPVKEIELENNKIHRTYKLQLTEENPPEGEAPWRIVLNQQENNRYLLEMYRKRGKAFQRFETISAQREGTSFALSDTDYGDKTCVISGGLGTMQVSFQGKSYWVCCTGCQAAFEEDPARWIREFEEKQKAED
jgi:hypothetical protein